MRVVVCVVACAAPAFGQPFVDVTDDLGLELGNGPAAWGDLNGDGWPDLSCGGAVWVNDGMGGGPGGGTAGFSRVGAPASGIIADIDNDGDGDLISFAPVGVWRNDSFNADAGSHFVPVPLPELPETLSRGAAVGDFDGDGLLDVYIGGYEVWDPSTNYPDLLLLSDGAGSFGLGMADDRRRARGVTACDFDEDGDLDVYVSNYRLYPNVLWVNDGSGVLTDRTAELGALATSEGFGGGHSIGACWGDFDGDGRIDLFAGNFAHVDSRGDQPKSRFLRNRGGAAEAGEHPGFEDLGECGVWYQESYASPAAADFDNDGDLDLYFTTVYAKASFGRANHPVLYRNDTEAGGAWTFTDVTEGSGLEALPPTYQAAWADFDGDGDVDLVTAGRLYENRLDSGAHWLGVRLMGGDASREGVGGQVRVRLGDGRVVTRQVELGTGEGNANSPLLHLGLGACGGPVDLEIVWPGGERQVVEGVAVDRRVEVARER